MIYWFRAGLDWGGMEWGAKLESNLKFEGQIIYKTIYHLSYNSCFIVAAIDAAIPVTAKPEFNRYPLFNPILS